MAYLLEKKVKGHSYWCIAQSKRDGKKVRQEIIDYIGDNKKLFERLVSASSGAAQTPVTIKSYSHGAAFSLYQIACLLHIPEILDENLPPRTRDGIPRSASLLLAAIHRAVRPDSKMSFADWFRTTTLPYYLGIDPDVMTSQHFWDQMDKIEYSELVAVEDAITTAILKRFPTEVEKLSLDYTNYFTYIDTGNERCNLAQRGHNKQKRYDLRQCSLAILALKGYGIPLYSQVYAGNINDATEFAEYTKSLKQRLPKENQKNITLIFDGGSNTKENLNNLGLHFICSFSLNSCKHLYDIPINDYQEIKLERKKVLAYRLCQEIWSKKRVCILTFSRALYVGQMRELEKNIQKATAELEQIKERLANPKSRIKRGAAELKKVCDSKLKKKYLKDIITVEVLEGYVNYEVCHKTVEETANKYFGKKLTITDHENWTTQAILGAYYDQDCIEKIFKDTKNVDHGCVQPIYHWTDQKMKVHIHICLLAQTLMGMLQKTMEDKGTKISKEKMIDELNEIRESWVKVMSDKDSKATGKITRQLEEMTPVQEGLWHIVKTMKS